MKINLELDDSDYMCSMFEAVTVQNLQWDLSAWESESQRWIHEDDMKANRKRIKAAKLLIKWYTGE